MSQKITRVLRRPNGQFVVTIPAGDADALELAGAHLSWRVESRNRITAKAESRTDEPATGRIITRVQYREDNGQYSVTIPAGLADAMRLDGAEVEWNIESRNKLSATVKSRDNDNE